MSPSIASRAYAELLTAPEKLSVEDIKQMQQDVYSVLAAELTPKIFEALGKRSSDADVQRARKRHCRNGISKWRRTALGPACLK